MTPVDDAFARLQAGGRAHLMGVGGIGMAGVAWLLKARGFEVSGCDLRGNRQTEWLARGGVRVLEGHDEAHVAEGVDWLIRSTAVPDDHPEVSAARKREIPVSRRGDVLPALVRGKTSVAVSGTHGKTTTTALIAQVLNCGFFVGGEIAGFNGAVARDGEIVVVEADESDGTVAGYAPDYAVITNIEYDHMEHHASEAAFVACFERLIAQTKTRVFYGADDRVATRICAGNPKCEPFRAPKEPFPIPLPGAHNQWNAAAAFAVASIWKSEGDVLAAMRRTRPIARRFETVADRDGVRVISDYAHHPTEVAALIQTARELAPKRLLGVFQPHRYTRTRALGADFPASFAGLDRLWLTPVYAASEAPIEGGTSADLAARFSAEWADRLSESASLEDAWNALRAEARAGDVVLIIGAGDIESLADRAREEIGFDAARA